MKRDFLDATPENTNVFSASHKRTRDKDTNKIKPDLDTSSMTLRSKLELLNELLIDTCIDNLNNNRLKPNDLASIVVLLKNNKVVEEKREQSESDLIDSLVL